MNPKDKILRELFAFIAISNENVETRGAQRIRKGNEIFYATRTTVLRTMASDDELKLTENEPHPIEGVEFLNKKVDVSQIDPAVAVNMSNIVSVTGLTDIRGLRVINVMKAPDQCNGLWLLRPMQELGVFERVGVCEYGDGKYLDFSQRLLRPFDAIERFIGASAGDMSVDTLMQLRPRISTVRLMDLAVLVLTGDTSLFYSVCATDEDKSAFTRVIVDGASFVGDAWNDALRCYKKLIKEKKMKGLSSMSKLVNKTADASNSTSAKAPVLEPTATPVIPKVEEPAKPVEMVVVGDVPSNLPETVTVATFVPESTPESAEEAPAATESVAEETTPARKRAPKRAATNSDKVEAISKVIELLGEAVEDVTVEQFDKSQDELRALRDLQIVAARRAANIATALAKMSKVALDKYEAIRQLMK